MEKVHTAKTLNHTLYTYICSMHAYDGCSDHRVVTSITSSNARPSEGSLQNNDHFTTFHWSVVTLHPVSIEATFDLSNISSIITETKRSARWL